MKGFFLTRFEGLLHTRFAEVSAYKEFPSDEEETGTVMVGWRAVHWRSFDEVHLCVRAKRRAVLLLTRFEGL